MLPSRKDGARFFKCCTHPGNSDGTHEFYHLKMRLSLETGHSWVLYRISGVPQLGSRMPDASPSALSRSSRSGVLEIRRWHMLSIYMVLGALYEDSPETKTLSFIG